MAACEADYRGRTGYEGRDYAQGRYLGSCLDAALSIQARDLDTRGVSGPEIGRRLRQARIEAIKKVVVEPVQ